MLENVVSCTGSVEVWLGNLLQEMQFTVQTFLSQIASSFFNAEFNFFEEFKEFCGQVGEHFSSIDLIDSPFYIDFDFNFRPV